MAMAATLDAVPGMRSGKRGRPRKRPDKLHADKAYDHRRCRRECRTRSIVPRIVRRGVETSTKLGRHRWVVERTFARVRPVRSASLTLAIRYDRRADIHMAFTKLATAIICMNQIRRFC
jgi:IS5 family transposase